MARVALQAQGLTVNAGRLTLIQPVDLVFHQGEFIGVLGPSGCGKSTLLRGLSGQQPLKGGTISMLGKALAQMSADERRRIGYVPQDDVVHGSLKVESSLCYSGRLIGLSGDALQARVDEVITRLELNERRRVRIDRLSGGQRKRVSIAAELMGSPHLLFLDEPTAGLDPALEESFMQTCRQLARSGSTLIMSTHVMQSLDALDLLLIMLKGHLVFLGPPQAALSYFGVSHLAQIYRPLAQQEPDQAARRYLSSPEYALYVRSRKA